MIDWKRETAETLREYPDRMKSIESTAMEIARLKSEADSIRSASADGAPVKGSSISAREDRLISNIVTRTELERAARDTQIWIARVEAALAELTPEERLILDRFYMHRQRGGLDLLCGELGLTDMSSLYRRKDRALRRFALLLYGCLST